MPSATMAPLSRRMRLHGEKTPTTCCWQTVLTFCESVWKLQSRTLSAASSGAFRQYSITPCSFSIPTTLSSRSFTLVYVIAHLLAMHIRQSLNGTCDVNYMGSETPTPTRMSQVTTHFNPAPVERCQSSETCEVDRCVCAAAKSFRCQWTFQHWKVCIA